MAARQKKMPFKHRTQERIIFVMMESEEKIVVTKHHCEECAYCRPVNKMLGECIHYENKPGSYRFLNSDHDCWYFKDKTTDALIFEESIENIVNVIARWKS